MGEVLHKPNTCLQQTHQNINNFIASIDKVYHFSPTTSLSLGFTHQYNRSTTEITTVDLVTRNRQTENMETFYAQGSFTLFNNFTIMHPMNFGNYNGRVAVHDGSSFDNEKWIWATSLNNTYRVPLGI